MFTFPFLSFLEYSSNLANLSVCLVTAILFFSFRTGHTDSKYGYGYLLKCLAWTALIVSAYDALAIYMSVVFNNISVLKPFLMPIVCYLQLHFVSSALFSLVHSSEKLHIRLRWLVLPIMFVSLIYLIAYVVENGFHLCYGCYVSFLENSAAKWISFLLYAIILVELVFYSAFIIRQSCRYREEIDDFFAGNKEEKSKVLLNIVCFFIAYFFVAVVNFLCCGVEDSPLSSYANIVLVWIDSLIFVLSSMKVLNISRFYYSVGPAFAWKEGDYVDLPVSNNEHIAESEKEGIDITNGSNHDIQQEFNNERSMDAVIQEWIDLPSKPYLRESITLAVAARQMNIHPRLLSSFINNIYHMNFNSWINSLRIDEVKRLINANPQQTLLTVALKTGFTDASAMSRVFKKFAGISPSEYRKNI